MSQFPALPWLVQRFLQCAYLSSDAKGCIRHATFQATDRNNPQHPTDFFIKQFISK
jgi:hypothetical protein